jgi:hypothetical protein
MNLRYTEQERLNLAQYPEVLAVVITLIMIGTIGITTSFLKSTSVELNDFKMEYNGIEASISPMRAGFGAILVVVTEAALHIAYRTYNRKFNKVRDMKNWYCVFRGFDINNMSLMAVYMVSVAWVVLCYSKFSSVLFIVWGIFLPGIILLMFY